MMEQKISKLNLYFEEQIALCQQCSRSLMDDDRADEAVLEKIRANVYDIFRTILAVAVKNGGGDAETVRKFFLQRAEGIPANWAASYEKARQQDDGVRMRIEQIKLDTIDEIKAAFARVWEEAE